MTKTIAFTIAVIFALMMTSTTLAFAAPQPNGQPFQALDSRITAIEQDNARSDSFFDVFFESYSVDSFFDIFTDLQESTARSDSFFDVFFESYSIDSFFDVFTELESATGDPDFDLLRNGRADFAIGDPDFDLLRNGVPDLGNEAAARAVSDTRLQSNIDAETAARVAADSQLQTRIFGVCPPGSSIRQVNPDGSVSCESDDSGTGSSGRLIVVQRVDTTPGELLGGGAVTSSFAPCLPGEMVVGGGYRASPASVNVFSESREFTEGAFGWFVNAYYESGTAPGFIIAIAECATIAP
jgi:hypothetical protein